MTLPDPLKVYSGEYQGEITYQITNLTGPNTIGFGVADYNGESELRIILKATVKHAFHYRFAPAVKMCVWQQKAAGASG